MATLDESTFQAVNNANYKATAEIGVQNMLAHQNRVNVIAERALAMSVDSLGNVSVPEGLGISAAQRGDLAKQIAELSAAVASIQANIKGGQTTPPDTSRG